MKPEWLEEAYATNKAAWEELDAAQTAHDAAIDTHIETGSEETMSAMLEAGKNSTHAYKQAQAARAWLKECEAYAAEGRTPPSIEEAKRQIEANVALAWQHN